MSGVDKGAEEGAAVTGPDDSSQGPASASLPLLARQKSQLSRGDKKEAEQPQLLPAAARLPRALEFSVFGWLELDALGELAFVSATMHDAVCEFLAGTRSLQMTVRTWTVGGQDPTADPRALLSLRHARFALYTTQLRHLTLAALPNSAWNAQFTGRLVNSIVHNNRDTLETVSNASPFVSLHLVALASLCPRLRRLGHWLEEFPQRFAPYERALCHLAKWTRSLTALNLSVQPQFPPPAPEEGQTLSEAAVAEILKRDLPLTELTIPGDVSSLAAMHGRAFLPTLESLTVCRSDTLQATAELLPEFKQLRAFTVSDYQPPVLGALPGPVGVPLSAEGVTEAAEAKAALERSQKPAAGRNAVVLRLPATLRSFSFAVLDDESAPRVEGGEGCTELRCALTAASLGWAARMPKLQRLQLRIECTVQEIDGEGQLVLGSEAGAAFCKAIAKDSWPDMRHFDAMSKLSWWHTLPEVRYLLPNPGTALPAMAKHWRRLETVKLRLQPDATPHVRRFLIDAPPTLRCVEFHVPDLPTDDDEPLDLSTPLSEPSLQFQADSKGDGKDSSGGDGKGDSKGDSKSGVAPTHTHTHSLPRLERLRIGCGDAHTLQGLSFPELTGLNATAPVVVDVRAMPALTSLYAWSSAVVVQSLPELLAALPKLRCLLHHRLWRLGTAEQIPASLPRLEELDLGLHSTLRRDMRSCPVSEPMLEALVAASAGTLTKLCLRDGSAVTRDGLVRTMKRHRPPHLSMIHIFSLDGKTPEFTNRVPQLAQADEAEHKATALTDGSEAGEDEDEDADADTGLDGDAEADDAAFEAEVAELQSAAGITAASLDLEVLLELLPALVQVRLDSAGVRWTAASADLY